METKFLEGCKVILKGKNVSYGFLSFPEYVDKLIWQEWGECKAEGGMVKTLQLVWTLEIVWALQIVWTLQRYGGSRLNAPFAAETVGNRD